MASTNTLPPPTCTARREAGQLRQLAVVLLQGLCRSDRPLAVFTCSGPVLPALCACSPLPCHAHCPCSPAPVQFCVCPRPLFISMCAGIVARGCKDYPVGNYNTGLQWRPVSPAEFIDPGPWFSVKFIRLSCIENECTPGMSVLAPAM